MHAGLPTVQADQHVLAGAENTRDVSAAHADASRELRLADPVTHEAEKIFGILADVDDAFLDDVMAIRRAQRARGGGNE